MVERQLSPHSATLLVSERDARAVALELAGAVHDRPVDPDRHVGHELQIRAHVDVGSEHLRRARLHAGEPLLEGELAHLEAVPVVGDGLVGELALDAVRRALHAHVGLVAEEQLEDRAGRIAHARLEITDATEQRGGEHAAVVEDHRLDHGRRS